MPVHHACCHAYCHGTPKRAFKPTSIGSQQDTYFMLRWMGSRQLELLEFTASVGATQHSIIANFGLVSKARQPYFSSLLVEMSRQSNDTN